MFSAHVAAPPAAPADNATLEICAAVSDVLQFPQPVPPVCDAAFTPNASPISMIGASRITPVVEGLEAKFGTKEIVIPVEGARE